MGARRNPVFAPLVGCLAIVVASLATSFSGTPAVVASIEQANPPETSLRLASQTPWVEPGGDAVFRLAVDTKQALEDLEVAATVHAGLTSRALLSSMLRSGRPGKILASPAPVAFGTLRTDADGNRLLPVGVQDPTLPRDAARVSLRADGVYPVEIRLNRKSDGTQLDRQITYLPVIKPRPNQIPLTVAVVWRLDASPSHGRDGQITLAKRAEIETQLGPIAMAIAAASSVPFTLAPVPETLDGWARTVGGAPAATGTTAGSTAGSAPDNAVLPPAGVSPSLQRLRATLNSPGRLVTMEPYAPIDFPSLYAAELGDEVDNQFAQGVAVMRELFGEPDTATLVTGVVDARSVDQLVLRGVGRVVIDAASVNLATQRFTPARPFTVIGAGRSRRLAAAIADKELGEMLAPPSTGDSSTANDDSPGARAAKFIAAATITALELPAQKRGVVVVASPSRGGEGAALVDAIAAALGTHPLLSAQTLDGYFDGVPQETDGRKPVVRTPKSLDPKPPYDTPADLRSARSRLRSFTALMGDVSPRVDQAERSLLLAESYTTGRSASRYRAGALGVINETIRQVEGPTRQTITLIGERAQIPVSFVNRTGNSLRVEVRLQSDKLLFPNGRRRMLTLAPRSTTAAFTVEARTPGTFPLFVTLTSPDGRILVAESELTIRSTAASGVGPILTAGAAAFLLGWWALHFRSARRRRNLA